MSTYYPKQGVSTCEIAGAIAQAALHDLRVNLFAFPGFPQIQVVKESSETFKVTLSFPGKSGNICSVSFELDQKLAFAAAKLFKSENIHDRVIFEPVQKALAQLESMVSH